MQGFGGERSFGLGWQILIGVACCLLRFVSCFVVFRLTDHVSLP
jgi:hypothetical protein